MSDLNALAYKFMIGLIIFIAGYGAIRAVIDLIF